MNVITVRGLAKGKLPPNQREINKNVTSMANGNFELLNLNNGEKQELNETDNFVLPFCTHN